LLIKRDDMKKIALLSVLSFSILFVAYSNAATTAGIKGQPSSQTTNPIATKPSRITLRIGYYMGTLKQTRSISWTQEVYQENAAYSVDYDAQKGNSFNAGIGYRFSTTLGVDVGLEIASRNLGIENSGSIPNPLYFNSPRAAARSVSSRLKENVMFFNLVYSVPTGAFEFDLAAGPAFFMTTAELTNGITFTESAYPYTTATINSQSESQKRNSFGFNIGTNLNYYFSRGVAFSIGVRYLSGKSTYATSSGTPSVNFGLGGLRLGGGLKFFF